MGNAIANYISQFIPLSEKDARIISEQYLFRNYKKNEILLYEGEYAKVHYFVISGCVRAYYLKNGEERNKEFFFENQIIRPLSFQTNQPSPYFLSCLEDCTLAIGSQSSNKKLLEQIPKLSSFVIQMNESMLIQKILELDNFKNHTPEERYVMLMENHPGHLDRIPLYHLASYLGITAISLSRIRSRISFK